jgi:hypothetical protein
MEQNIKNAQEESIEIQKKQKIKELREKLRKDSEMSYKIFMEDIMGVKEQDNEEVKNMNEKAQEQEQKEKEVKKEVKNMNENEVKAKDQENSNMALWLRVEKTNPKFTKLISYGQRHFTAIGAYYQIKTATQIWGPYGKTWGLKNSELEITKIGNVDMAIYKAVFYYPEGEFEIRNSIKIADDEFLKKLETDTLTKALSRLGFNADVFLGLFEDLRYVNDLKKEFGDENESKTSQTSQQSQPQSQPAQPQSSQPQQASDDLETLGIVIKNEGNLLIADGDTFNHKNVLKSKGFAWDSNLKKWVKKIA